MVLRVMVDAGLSVGRWCARAAIACLLAAPAVAQGPDAIAGRPPEAVRWLQEYLQIDTTNPPGGEEKAAEYLAAIAREGGAEVRVLRNGAGRASMVARFAAEAPRCGGALALLHHIDVVPAGEDWRAPPFSGRFHEERIWGRGAIDIKSLGIAQLAAAIAVRRSGQRFCRDVLVVAVADEETGGKEGTAWLLERHPELFAGVDAVLNEGGNNRVNNGRVVFWGVEVVQKRPLWLRVSAAGRGGHGSRFAPMSATHQLVTGLARLIERRQSFRVSDAARLFYGSLARLEDKDPALAIAALEEATRGPNPAAALGAGQQAYFVDSVQVTQIDTAPGINVIAPRATGYVDIRLLPDTDADAFLAGVRELLGPALEVEVVLAAPQVAPSPMDHPIYRALERVLGERAPLIPSFLPGTTDSRYFRERGIAAYGFSPFAIDSPDLQGIHAPNEYIRPAAFQRGIETLRRLLEAYAVGP
jgi:acetylornithine deacetylase/succinyl-diaminopimelate desuccinylase-like protein